MEIEHFRVIIDHFRAEAGYLFGKNSHFEMTIGHFRVKSVILGKTRLFSAKK